MSDDTQNIVRIEDEVPPEKMEVYLEGKELKETGDKLFKADPKAALSKYHRVLLHWKGLNRQNPATGVGQGDSKPKSQLDEELGKVYSNMSACHMVLKNYDRVIETANQALTLNKDNYKALFRKAKALGEQGYFEKAEPILSELLTKYPAEAPTIKAEIEALCAKDKERERKANRKLKGFLNSAKEIFDTESAPNVGGNEMAPSARIEEVDSTKEKQDAKSLPTPELVADGDATISAKIEEVTDE